MTVQALDTHAVVKELMAAGFTDAQAEAVTGVVRRSQDVDLSSLATKADLEIALAAFRSEMQIGLSIGRSELQVGLASTKSDLERAKAEIVRRVVGTIGLQTLAIIGAAVALVKLAAH